MITRVYKILNQFILDHPTNERINTTFKSRYGFLTSNISLNYTVYSNLRDKLVYQYLKYTDYFKIPEETRKVMKDSFVTLMSAELNALYFDKRPMYIRFFKSNAHFNSRVKMKLDDINMSKVKIAKEMIELYKEVLFATGYDKLAIWLDGTTANMDKRTAFYNTVAWIMKKTVQGHKTSYAEAYKKYGDNTLVVIKKTIHSNADALPGFKYFNMYSLVSHLKAIDPGSSKLSAYGARLTRLDTAAAVDGDSGIRMSTEHLLIHYPGILPETDKLSSETCPSYVSGVEKMYNIIGRGKTPDSAIILMYNEHDDVHVCTFDGDVKIPLKRSRSLEKLINPSV